MNEAAFHTPGGTPVPAVTADEMREVDRIAVEDVGLTLTRMMEHAGRSLAAEVFETGDVHLGDDRPIAVVAGGGGNGGGGLVCARHLANRGIPTRVVLDREPADVSGVPGEQLDILRHVESVTITSATDSLPTPSLVVDALLGYGLDGAPRNQAATLIEWVSAVERPVVSLDVPSGVDATTGETPGQFVEPKRTLTLALPKTGLAEIPGTLTVADLSIPGTVYDRLGIPAPELFGSAFRASVQ